MGAVLLLLSFACGPAAPVVEPTPTTEPDAAHTPEPKPVDALVARRQDTALRVCDALENTLLVSEPAFLSGAVEFARSEGLRKSELLEAMARNCPGPFNALRYETGPNGRVRDIALTQWLGGDQAA